MPKSSTKEKPDFDEVVHHFPSHVLTQQTFEKNVTIPVDYATQLALKKNMSKTNLKVLSREVLYKKSIPIERIQQYIRTPDDIIILCVVGNDVERAKFKAFKFKTSADAERFIEKLTIRDREIKREAASQNQTDDNVSTGTSVRSRNQTTTKLSEYDFSTFGRRKSKMGTENVYGADEEPKYNDEDTLDDIDEKSRDVLKEPDDKYDYRGDYNEKKEKYDDIGEDYEDSLDKYADYKEPTGDYQGYNSKKDLYMPEVVPSMPIEVSHAGRRMDDWRDGPLLMTEACDMTKVRAPEFGKIPSKLPINISDDLSTQKLQYTGDTKIYEDGLEFINKNTNDVLFSAPYSEIKNIHEFGKQPTNLLLFRDDHQRKVSQMVLLNFDSRSGTRNVSNILKNKDIMFYQYEPPKEFPPVSVTSNNFSESSNDFFEPIKPLKDAPGQYSGRTSSFSGKDSQFDTISIKETIPRKRTEQFNVEDLKRMPDEGPWDYNLVFLKQDPNMGVVADDEGSVYMFVAHKVKS